MGGYQEHLFPWIKKDDVLYSEYSGFYPVISKFINCSDDEHLSLNLIADCRKFGYTQCELDETLAGRDAWNGKTLVLHGLEEGPPAILHVSHGNYYDTLVASRRLRDELGKLQATDNVAPAPVINRKDTPLLNAIHQQLEPYGETKNFWGKEGVNAALSVSTAFFVFDGHEYLLAYSKRSGNVVEQPGLYHLVPSMLLQPQEDISASSGGYQVIRNMVLQEVAEEVFSEPGSHGPDAIDTARLPALQSLSRLLDHDAAEFAITGLATDIVTFRPEILSILIVHDASWYQAYKSSIHPCEFEYQKDDGQQGSPSLFKAFDPKKLFSASGPFAPGRCVATAAACLIAGLGYLESTLKEKSLAERRQSIAEIRPAIEPDKELIDKISAALINGCVTNNGPQLKQFESMAAEFLGVERALGVSNGSDALYIALRLFRNANKKRVVLPSYTYRATLNAIIENGLTPLFCDIEPDSFTLCTKHLASLLERYDDIGCIVPVNVFGVTPELTSIRKLADRYQAYVIYDNAQGFGARYYHQRAPQAAHIQIFSLHATKVLPAIEGGLIVSPNSQLMDEVDVIRNHGISSTAPLSWHWGVNSKLDEIRAMVALHSLRKFDEILSRRRHYGNIMRQAILRSPLAGMFLPQKIPERCSTNYQNFAVVLKHEGQREAVIAQLKALGVGSRSYFNPPLHHLDCFESSGELKNTEYIWQNLISLPIHSRMEAKELDAIINGLMKIKIM